MSDDRVRTLVACGAAGGIAATFNAPIAGVFFALEIILGEFTTRAFGIVVLASLTASVIGRAAFGNTAAFPVPSYELVSVSELPLYALLAVLAAVVGFGFTRTLYWFEDRFDDIPMKEYLKPLPGGLMVGALGLGLPQIFGVGYPAMEKALHGEYAFGLLSLLILAKILAVSLTIGSGGSGGVFAPVPLRRRHARHGLRLGPAHASRRTRPRPPELTGWSAWRPSSPPRPTRRSRQ